MKISPEKLAAEAAATDFRTVTLEKVANLLGLLNALQSHPFLKGKLVLKGGTALNLFVFDVPRLSVDIDLNSENSFFVIPAPGSKPVPDTDPGSGTGFDPVYKKNRTVCRISNAHPTNTGRQRRPNCFPCVLFILRV